MTTAKRWVCTACKAVWYIVYDGLCPSCRGTCKEATVKYDESGRAIVE